MFRTELSIAPQERQLSRTARVLTIGSCFADSIGQQLHLNKVTTLVNPFGTVFQPLALAQLLRAAAGEDQDWQQHLVEARGRWQSFDLHSTLGAESPVELLQTIQDTVHRVGEFVRTADAVVLTLGTAWAYRLRETGELVSNLHKLPASLFDKELLTADEIVNALAEVHALLRRENPDLRIVLTVSPVRHLKDTLPLNAVSKSVLRVACHYLSELLPGVSYFPAYELLNDDLRDYRFYATDMLHPSPAAEEYVWERFARAYFDADFGRFRKEWAAVRQSLGHRPLHDGAPEHRHFLDQTHAQLERLASQGVEVRQELRDVQRQLAALPPPKPVRAPEPELDDDEERIDIGSDVPAANGQATPPAEQPGRPRRGDRRGGRNRDERRPRPERPAQVVPEAEAVPEEEFEVATAEELADVVPAASAATTSAAAPAEALALEEASAYPAKKKKRRSRGGAKRTARKNAAKLAAGQDATEAPSLAEEVLLEEQAQEAAGFAVELPLDAPSIPTPLPEPATSPSAEAEVTAPATPRKRGAGPTPKKSTVIAKSGPVKRGQRSGLYRAAASEATEAALPAAHPATAPIISPPIIPEVLLERPAVDLAAPSLPAAEPDLAATVLGLTSSKAPLTLAAAPKPRRGRPKAAVTAAPESVAPELVLPEPAVAKPAVAEAPAPEITPAAAPTPKKLGPRAPKAAKVAPAKKVAAKKAPVAKAPAKPAATKRGRPPGKKAAPAADALTE